MEIQQAHPCATHTKITPTKAVSQISPQKLLSALKTPTLET